jgi:hypothetical protein
MIRFCKDCKHASARAKEGGVEVMCSQPLVPESWRGSWIFRSTVKCITDPLKCPSPEQWFDQKGN